MKRSTVQTRLLLIFGILILIGFLSTRFSVRLDYTGDKRYTLSEATTTILKNLQEPVTVTAYFTEKVPPYVAVIKNEVTDLLTEYANRSGGNVVFDFVDPAKKPETEQEVMQKGIQPVTFNVREKNEIKQQKGYLGIMVKMGDQTDVIPALESATGLEYKLSSSILKVSSKVKPKVAFLEGQGEASLNSMVQLRMQLAVAYDPSSYSINDTAPIPNTYESLVIVAPKDSFSATQLQRLDEYVAGGGNLLIAMNRVAADFASGVSGYPVYTGLENWLSKKGITVEEKFVMDAQCDAISIQYQNSFFAQQMPFPYSPIISNFSNHPISKGLGPIGLPLASPITWTLDTTAKVVVLARTSTFTNTAPGTVSIDPMRQYTRTKTDFPLDTLPVAIAVEGKLGGNNVSRLVVIGDGDFPVNGEGQGARRLNDSNISLMANAVDWLADNTGLNELRTKVVASRPIKKELSDNETTMIKYSNFLAPILLVVLYGVVLMQLRKRKRMKWMEERYV